MPAEAVLPISMAKSFILALFVEPNVLKKPSTYSVPSVIAADFSKFASSTAASKVTVLGSSVGTSSTTILVIRVPPVFPAGSALASVCAPATSPSHVWSPIVFPSYSLVTSLIVTPAVFPSPAPLAVTVTLAV